MTDHSFSNTKVLTANKEVEILKAIKEKKKEIKSSESENINRLRGTMIEVVVMFIDMVDSTRFNVGSESYDLLNL